METGFIALFAKKGKSFYRGSGGGLERCFLLIGRVIQKSPAGEACICGLTSEGEQYPTVRGYGFDMWGAEEVDRLGENGITAVSAEDYTNVPPDIFC